MDGLIAIVVAATSATPPFLTWLSDRARKGKRNSVLQELRLRIEVVDAWIHARQLLPNVMDQELLDSSQQELRNLFKAYKDISSIEATGASGREDMHWLKRAFILYPTTSKKARRIKIAFWLILITSAMAITGAAIPKPGADPSLEYLLTHPSIFVALIPFLLAIVVLQNMAENQRRSDRSKS